MRSFCKSVLVVLLLLFLSQETLKAQLQSMRDLPGNKTSLELTMRKPFYKLNYTYGFLTGAYNLKINTPISSRFNIIGDISLTHYNFEYMNLGQKESISETGFGNIFVGLQTRPDQESKNKSVLTFGVFIPVATREGSRLSLADPYNFQRYWYKSLGLYFNYTNKRKLSNSFQLTYEVGPNLAIWKDGGDSEIDLLAHYGINLEYNYRNWFVSVEATGTFLMTRDINNFSDRFSHKIGICIGWDNDIISPKAFYNFYLDNSNGSYYIDGVLGIGLNVKF